MKRDVIKFNNSGKLVATGNDVLMTSTELGELFDVCPVQVERAVQRLIKRGVFDKYAIYKTIPVEGHEDKPGWKREVYDMNVIMALAYEWDNAFTHSFRKWLAEKATSQQKEAPAVFIQCGKGFVC